MGITVLIIFGFLVGAIGTLAGIGGGIFIVPFLMLACGFTPQLAVGTGLLVVLCNSFSGTIAYAFQKQRIDYRTGVLFTVFVLPGVVLGSYALGILPENIFKPIFAVILIIIAVYQIIRKHSGSPESETDHPVKTGPGRYFLLAVVSCLTGIIAGFLGIGGGIIHIPVLIFLVGLNVHRATATSHFILFFTSLTAVIDNGIMGQIDYRTGLILGFGAILGAQAGAYISKRTRPRVIILMLSAVLILTALRMLVNL
ncbi:MAG: sulfite exporter TauE/SafE family protein [Candidatus Brocadiia bacterium]